MAGKEITLLGKFSTYHKEKSKAWKNDISKVDNWDYNETKKNG
jgi:hypothetical protein